MMMDGALISKHKIYSLLHTHRRSYQTLSMVIDPHYQPSQTRKARWVIYGTNWCPFCKKAKTLLNFHGRKFRFVDLDKKENKRVRDKMVKVTHKTSIPMVFYKGEFVGGFDDLTKYFDKLVVKSYGI